MSSTSAAFKSPARDKPPSWSNRIRKDANDLMYNVKQVKDIQFIKKKPNTIDVDRKMKNIITQSKNNSWMKKQEISPFKNNFDLSTKASLIKKRSESLKNLSLTQKILRKSINPQTYFSSSSIKQKIHSNSNQSQKKQLIKKILTKQKKQLKKVEKLGLSDFQFCLKTIQGRILSRNGYNVDLDKCKTIKYNPVKQIYYNESNTIPKEDQQKEQNIKRRKVLMKYRSFDTYQSHTLHGTKPVGEGGCLDKFYSISNQQLNLVKIKSSPPKFDIKKISPRCQPPQKLGTQLQYDSYQEISKSNKSKPLFDILQTQRNLVISKQIISPKRGCYR